MLLTGLMVSAALAGGFFGIYKGYEKHNEAQKQLEAQKKQFENQRTKLDEDFRRAKTRSYANWDTFRTQTGQAIAQTEYGQHRNQRIASMVNASQDTAEQAQVNNTIIQGEMAKGSLRENVAQSGFRRSGTLEKAETQQVGQIEQQVGLAKAQARVSSRARFAQASADYLNAEAQKASYEENLKIKEQEFNRNIEQMTADYSYSYDQLTDAINNVQYAKEDLEANKGFNIFSESVSTAFNWGQTVYSAGSGIKQNDLTNRQIKYYKSLLPKEI